MAKCKECGKEFSVSFWKLTPTLCSECGQEMAEGVAAFQGVLAESTPRLFVTPIVFWLNTLIFAVMALSGVSFLSPTIEQLLAWGANFGPLAFSGEWWRPFSATFIHIGVLHLAVNMWCLWNLGKLAERMFGNWTFLGLYVFSGLGGSVASLWWHPMVVSAGASGAVFGVAGGLIAFFYLGNLTVPPAVLKQNRKNILLFAAYNLFHGFGESGIDNAGHLGGLATGLLIGALLHRPLPAPKPLPRRRYSVVFSAVALCLVIGFMAVSRGFSPPYGKMLNFKAVELFYTDSVTETEAKRLGEHLIDVGFGENSMTAQLNKSGDTYQFRMVVIEGAEQDQGNILIFQQIAIQLSNAVFGSAPVEIHLCDESLETLKVAKSDDVDTHDLVEQLVKQGMDVNAKGEDGMTVLMEEAYLGQTEMVNALIDAGADVNAKDNDGWTALMKAAHYGRTETVDALIDAGADVNIKTKSGQTALMFAETMGRTEIVEILKKAGARE